MIPPIPGNTRDELVANIRRGVRTDSSLLCSVDCLDFLNQVGPAEGMPALLVLLTMLVLLTVWARPVYLKLTVQRPLQ